MRKGNIISKFSRALAFSCLAISLMLGVLSTQPTKVEATSDTYTVTFDYNAEALSSNMPLNATMQSSIENYTALASAGGYVSLADIRYPSSLFNPYYSYTWTYNGAEIDNITSVQIIKDTTFTIKWTPVTYYVNFNFASSDIKSKVTNLQEKITFTVESPRIELYKPEVPHYIFDGWYNGSVPYDMLYIPAGSIGTKNLTARFTPKQYNIRYNTDATNTDNPKTYNVTDGTITLAEASKEGHIFKGWYSNASLTSRVTTIDCSLGGNIELYAKWELKEYTVTFIMPDGTTRLVKVGHGGSVGLPDVDKTIFEVVSANRSTNYITSDTVVKITKTNIWYVYPLAILLIVGIIVAIVHVRRKEDRAYDTLRDTYERKLGKPAQVRVSIIEKQKSTSYIRQAPSKSTTKPIKKTTPATKTSSTKTTKSKAKTTKTTPRGYASKLTGTEKETKTPSAKTTTTSTKITKK